MGSKTGIEWTDATWNPIIGCSRVSEGCRNCYAEGIAGRFGQGKQTVYSGLTQIVNGRAVWTGKIVETRQLLQPLSWRKPKRVFVNSMSDLFHENVTDEQRDRIFAVMALCPQHTFQVLTKRPERMLKYFHDLSEDADSIGRAVRVCMWVDLEVLKQIPTEDQFDALARVPKGLPNVWLGVSVENQAAADQRIPVLLTTPAAVRFISAEPLLGPVKIPGEQMLLLDWIICGGESGPHARPMHPDWARSLRDQCERTDTAFFFKQWGEWMHGSDFRESARIVLTNGHVYRTSDQAAPDEREQWNSLHPEMMAPVGKKAAGAVLDGLEWKEFPVEA